jgi:hypothetical protein
MGLVVADSPLSALVLHEEPMSSVYFHTIIFICPLTPLTLPLV